MMGMYNVVNVPGHIATCENCGEMELGEWQTKDNPPLTLSRYDLKESEIERCYNFCPFCDAWIELEKSPIDKNIVTKKTTIRKPYTIEL